MGFQKIRKREKLMNKNYKIGYTTGVFDMFHIGHLNILKKAKEQCEYLIVGVTTDALCYARKNKMPIICEADRVEIVSSIKYVDKVVLQNDMDKLKAVQEHKIDAVFVGSDWKGTPSWENYEKQFATLNCEVVYLDHTDGISSTILRERLNDRL
jgi:glycerol-3-phosphate cytidylyltransferase